VILLDVYQQEVVMTKKIVLAILVLTLTASLTARAPFWSAVTYQIAVPMGNTSDYISNTSFLGGGVEGRYMLNPRVSAGFSLDWNYYSQGNRSSHMFPTLFNLHVYLGRPGVQPYIGIGVGSYYIRSWRQFSWGWSWEDSWHFGFSPEFGFAFRRLHGPPFGFMIGARFHYAVASGPIPDQSYWAFKMGAFWGSW
jgi:hypothetical protein